MKDNYAACLKVVLRNEGGYVNNPKDPGGETNYGITKATARANGYGASMRSIPMSVVERIYGEKFWNTASYKGDALDRGVDLAVFDFGVNSGPARAGKALKASAGGSAVDTIKKVFANRLSFLHALKTWRTFGPGWLKRCTRTEADCLKMADATAVVPAQKESEKKRTVEATKAGGTATAGGATTQTPDAPLPHHVDPTAFDWSTLIYVGIGVAVVGLVVFFVYRAIVQHHRATALAAAAKGII